MIVDNSSQGSSGWFQARAGKVTASKVAAVLAFGKIGEKKGKELAARADYRAQIVAETLSHMPMMDGYLNPYMQWGTEQEQYARAAYEARYDVLTSQVGFVYHPTIERAGASPDSLLGVDGVIEIKAPKTDTHLKYMLEDRLPPDYEPQVQWQLACTERKFADFVSFDPRLPLRHQLFVKRVERDDARIAEMEAGVIQFLSEVDALIAELNARNPEIAEAAQEIEHPEDFLSDAELDAVFGRKA
jgi:putative phage-type endonuclease